MAKFECIRDFFDGVYHERGKVYIKDDNYSHECMKYVVGTKKDEPKKVESKKKADKEVDVIDELIKSNKKTEKSKSKK